MYTVRAITGWCFRSNDSFSGKVRLKVVISAGDLKKHSHTIVPVIRDKDITLDKLETKF